jgi:hypothetical protein
VSGAGQVIFAGSNSYTGVTQITAGRLTIKNSAGLGTTDGGTVVYSGTALEVDGTAGALSVGAEALTLYGTGITAGGALRNIAGTNTFAGAITLGATGTRINSDAGILTLSGGVSGTNTNLLLGGTGTGIGVI